MRKFLRAAALFVVAVLVLQFLLQVRAEFDASPLIRVEAFYALRHTAPIEIQVPPVVLTENVNSVGFVDSISVGGSAFTDQIASQPMTSA